MSNLKVAILGASGYTGGELLRFLLAHPNVDVVYLTADRHSGKKIETVFPNLRGIIDCELSQLSIDNIPNDLDFVFIALPHGKSSEIVKFLFNKNLKIIDLGADFRLSYENYKKWYGEHPCPELIEEAEYGLSEINGESIKSAKLVANPGCYPMSSILPLTPLLADNLISENSIVIDSKSGVSGAGRSPSLDLHFSEVNEGIRSYKIGQHRHTPEIEEILTKHSGLNVKVSFTPHLIPMDRGILSTIYIKLNKKFSTSDLLKYFEKYYSGSKFIRIHPEDSFPSTSDVKYSNYCDIGLRVNEDNNSAVLVSVIDNLVKGASGQAVQNMNIMTGFPEELGIDNFPIFP